MRRPTSSPMLYCKMSPCCVRLFIDVFKTSEITHKAQKDNVLNSGCEGEGEETIVIRVMNKLRTVGMY